MYLQWEARKTYIIYHLVDVAKITHNIDIGVEGVITTIAKELHSNGKFGHLRLISWAGV